MRVSYTVEGQAVGPTFVLFWRACGLVAIGMVLYKDRVPTGKKPRNFYV
jgi:hypothetical protein